MKLLYSYPLNDLYSDKEISEKVQEKKSALKASGALTQQGNLALELVQETTQSFARQNIEDLINANKLVRTKISG